MSIQIPGRQSKEDNNNMTISTTKNTDSPEVPSDLPEYIFGVGRGGATAKPSVKGDTEMASIISAIKDRSAGELVAIFNKCSEKPVKKFASKAKALQRIAKLDKGLVAIAAGLTKSSKTKGAAKTAGARKQIQDQDRISAGKVETNGKGCFGALEVIIGRLSSAITVGALIKKCLAEYQPPRSGLYDETYVRGYLSTGVARGHFSVERVED